MLMAVSALPQHFLSLTMPHAGVAAYAAPVLWWSHRRGTTHTPLQVWKVAPALAAGNAVILKPSEYASVTSLELGAIAGGKSTAGC